MRGLVIKNTGSWYTVKTDDGRTIESKIKGNFRLKGIRSTNPVAVGAMYNSSSIRKVPPLFPKLKTERTILYANRPIFPSRATS